MNIELNTIGTASHDLLDTQVILNRNRGNSPLSVEFLYRSDIQDDCLQLPPLSWYDAQQLQQFTTELASVKGVDTCQKDLPDAGIRLTGCVKKGILSGTSGRTIRVEALSKADRSFVPFSINGSQHEIQTYARKLYNRLWEAFCRG